MAITKETIQGTKIINEIKSSNIKLTEYDTESKKLVVEFNNGFWSYYYDGGIGEGTLCFLYCYNGLFLLSRELFLYILFDFGL